MWVFPVSQRLGDIERQDQVERPLYLAAFYQFWRSHLTEILSYYDVVMSDVGECCRC
jgi:hypothetical protein